MAVGAWKRRLEILDSPWQESEEFVVSFAWKRGPQTFRIKHNSKNLFASCPLQTNSIYRNGATFSCSFTVTVKKNNYEHCNFQFIWKMKGTYRFCCSQHSEKEERRKKEETVDYMLYWCSLRVQHFKQY